MLHQWAIAMLGMVFGELFDLEEIGLGKSDENSNRMSENTIGKRILRIFLIPRAPTRKVLAI